MTIAYRRLSEQCSAFTGSTLDISELGHAWSNGDYQKPAVHGLQLAWKIDSFRFSPNIIGVVKAGGGEYCCSFDLALL